MLLRVLRLRTVVNLDGVKPHLINYNIHRTIMTEIRETLFLRAHKFGKRTAIIDHSGSHSYEKILRMSFALGERLIKLFGGNEDTNLKTKDLQEKRVAFLCPSDVSYVASQWAVWRNGGIAVPLCDSHPESLWHYVLTDCQADAVITTSQYASTLQNLADKNGMEFMLIDEELSAVQKEQNGVHELTEVEKKEMCWDERGAMIVYTSGTTGPPKGVLTTHGNIRAQITAMTEAWEWSENDVILHVLPLHHVHGIINVLCCPLYVGATCYMQKRFDAVKVWNALQSHNPPGLSLFMAVPTIYAKLIEYYENCNHSDAIKEEIKKQCQKLRLMVSGSAALPEPIMTRWEKITGQVLLERYGMTEFAMALTNPLTGPRIPGSVGKPFPGIEVRIVAKDEENANEVVVVEGNAVETKVTPGVKSKEGELQVRGAAVFKRYWNKPEATKQAFTEDGWFKTGDTVGITDFIQKSIDLYQKSEGLQRLNQTNGIFFFPEIMNQGPIRVRKNGYRLLDFTDGIYRIRGRTSVDIIKSGGYKISALSIERRLLSHEDILDCAVLGVPDSVWGERVAAIITCRPKKTLSLETLRQWASSNMAPYEIPTKLKVVDSIPKNTMGKVNKKDILKRFFCDSLAREHHGKPKPSKL